MVSTLPSATGPADHRVVLIVGAHYSYSDVPAQYTWSTCASHHFMSEPHPPCVTTLDSARATPTADPNASGTATLFVLGGTTSSNGVLRATRLGHLTNMVHARPDQLGEQVMRESLTAQRRHRAVTVPSQRRRPFLVALLPVVLGATTALSWVGPAQATVGGPVGTAPASFTPSLATSGTDGSVEQVRQLVPCGPTMYAVGRFTSIKQAGTTYPRNNAFSFSSTTGAVSTWNPNVNGRVDSVALSADCSTAYLGGKFTSVGGTTVTNIASVST